MKKFTLFIAASLFVFIAVSQKATLKQQAQFNTTVTSGQEAKVNPDKSFEISKDPIVSTGSRDQDIVIGNTWYDLQTNFSTSNRIYVFDDGTMSAVWTFSPSDDFSYRGTGYNYFDGSSWGPNPNEKLEEMRTGWPSVAPYRENGEISVAHTVEAEGLIFSWRENKGTGDWNFFRHNGVEPLDTLYPNWPRMITTGENNDNIHIVSVLGYREYYEGIFQACTYSRSTDGGLSWDYDNVILDGMGSEYAKFWGQDRYNWAQPNPNAPDVIAFVVFNGISDGVIMKSENNGDSWERITFYDSPDPFFDGNGGDLPKCGGGDGWNTIAIDDDGLCHIAFGRQVHIDTIPDDLLWEDYLYSDGLIYWNESMPALDSTQITSIVFPTMEEWEATSIYQNGQLAAWTQPHGEDTIVGIARYRASLTSMPQIVIDDSLIYIFCSAVAVGYDDGTYNYRHIWGTYTEGDGTWSEFKDYTNDVYHTYSECVFPSVAKKITDNTFHILYKSDILPGPRIHPTPPAHEFVNNLMVYLPVSPHLDIRENNVALFEVSEIFPNPVSSQTYLTVTLEERMNLNLTISSATGKIVEQSNRGNKAAGTHTLSIQADDFVPGVYLVTVSGETQKVVRKMIVL